MQRSGGPGRSSHRWGAIFLPFHIVSIRMEPVPWKLHTYTRRCVPRMWASLGIPQTWHAVAPNFCSGLGGWHRHGTVLRPAYRCIAEVAIGGASHFVRPRWAGLEACLRGHPVPETPLAGMGSAWVVAAQPAKDQKQMRTQQGEKTQNKRHPKITTEGIPRRPGHLE